MWSLSLSLLLPMLSLHSGCTPPTPTPPSPEEEEEEDPGEDSSVLIDDTAKGEDSATGDDTGTEPVEPCTDLNCDGWPDLVFSSASPGYARVFWGSKDGYGDYTELPVVWTKGNFQVDLDGDGDLDLVFARLMEDGTSLDPDTESYLLYTESVDPYTVRVETLPTYGAHGVAAGDLDGDGLPEVVFTNHGDERSNDHDLTVFWSGPEGFSADRSLGLPASGGHGLSLGDVNADGLLDVIVSNYYDGRTRRISSFIYLNDKAGLDAERVLALPTIGARGNRLVDINQDGYLDLLFAHHYDDTQMELSSVAFLGGYNGLEAARAIPFPTVGAHTVEAVDCNQDGYIDLFWANQRFDTQWTPGTRSWYYLGSASGWSAESRVTLETFGASGTSARDLNRDGWIDLVVANFREGEDRNVRSAIYWGGPDCWSDDRRTELVTASADAVSSGPNEMGY